LPPQPPGEKFNPVKEADETNNARAEDINVTPVPANLKVTHIDVPQVNYSGETVTFTYTVTNVGSFPVWDGTRSWRDFLWLSADPSFIRTRASYLGESLHVQQTPLMPGQSYNVSFTTKLPEGTDGQYYLYIDLDAHNDLSPLFFPYQARLLLTDWYP